MNIHDDSHFFKPMMVISIIIIILKIAFLFYTCLNKKDIINEKKIIIVFLTANWSWVIFGELCMFKALDRIFGQMWAAHI